jgi:uncharacterized SAM-binding protein YcdF (DUF218 family)
LRLGRKRLWLALAVLLAAAIVGHSWWLAAIGSFLVRAEAPHQADAVVVLGGDYYGLRIIRAGELVRKGYAPFAVVAGGEDIYGVPESELAIALAVKRGFPRDYFVPVEETAFSTKEEVGPILNELRRRHVRSALVVTSNFHTRRAGSIWRSRAEGIDITMVAAPDRFYDPDAWWKTREGRKTAFYEWVKTVTEPFGM